MDAKDEVKEKLRVEDVVEDYLELKRSGRNFKAMSPFTNEKTASLMVSPEKQIWHDFSSNKGGDMFSFVMEMEGIDFRGALELLARKAGVDLSQFSGISKERAQRKERMYEMNKLAVKYYHATLAKNKTALNYVVKNRGYGKKILAEFELGYSPASGSALTDFLAKRKFKQSDIKDSGLAVRRGGKLVDMFRGRIMVPLHDGQGRPIGFTARVLDDSLPKYINTAQTMVYDKSRHVFGLHLAKDDIRNKNYVVMVEGNMDVVASHKTSVKNIVATAGTAMTKEHLMQISRLTQDVRLAFDQDRAGLAATERAIPIAQETDVRLSIITIPEGKDPDDLVKKDPELWKEAVEKSKYVIDWLLDYYKKEFKLDSAEGKKKYSDKILTVVQRLQDPVEIEHYVQKLAKTLNVNEKTVESKLYNLKSPKKRFKKNKATKVQKPSKLSAYQDQLLGLAFEYPDLRDSLYQCKSEYFKGETRQKLFKYIVDHDTEPLKESAPDLHEMEDYVKIILFKTQELYEGWSSPDRLIEAIGLVRRLIQDHNQKQQKDISEQIRQAEAAGDSAKVEKLLKAYQELLKEP